MSGFALGFFCGLGYVGILVGTARLCALNETSDEDRAESAPVQSPAEAENG